MADTDEVPSDQQDAAPDADAPTKNPRLAKVVAAMAQLGGKAADVMKKIYAYASIGGIGALVGTLSLILLFTYSISADGLRRRYGASFAVDFRIREEGNHARLADTSIWRVFRQFIDPERNRVAELSRPTALLEASHGTTLAGFMMIAGIASLSVFARLFSMISNLSGMHSVGRAISAQQRDMDRAKNGGTPEAIEAIEESKEKAVGKVEAFAKKLAETSKSFGTSFDVMGALKSALGLIVMFSVTKMIMSNHEVRRTAAEESLRTVSDSANEFSTTAANMYNGVGPRAAELLRKIRQEDETGAANLIRDLDNEDQKRHAIALATLLYFLKSDIGKSDRVNMARYNALVGAVSDASKHFFPAIELFKIADMGTLQIVPYVGYTPAVEAGSQENPGAAAAEILASLVGSVQNIKANLQEARFEHERMFRASARISIILTGTVILAGIMYALWVFRDPILRWAGRRRVATKERWGAFKQKRADRKEERELNRATGVTG